MTRPAFHLTAASGWINDPHGITYRDGQYHVFFQYVPESTVWAPNCHWGHAVGPDLIALAEQPIAIAPGDGDDGIWTGSLVTDDQGTTRIFYTSTTQPNIGIGRIRVATPTDDEWNSWQKGDFVADAPAELDIIAYRDPFLIREPDGWRMIVGAGLADGTATALSYHSRDLESWAYEGVALARSTHEREPVWMGALWECPQFIVVDGRHVMVSSVWDDDVLHYAGYALGDYASGKFTADTWGRLTHGTSYYAPSFFCDAAGRPCLTFWMRGVEDVEAGWASAHSVAHVLTVEGDRLVATPHPDLVAYRQDELSDGALPSVSGDIEWTPQNGHDLVVTSDTGARILRLEVTDGVLTADDGDGTSQVPVDGTVRIILDAGAVEISSKAGILGLAIRNVAQSYRVAGENARVWPLSRDSGQRGPGEAIAGVERTALAAASTIS